MALGSPAEAPHAKLSPLLLAENIDPTLLTAQYQAESAEERDWDPAKRNWRQAWALLELVVHHDSSDEAVADYLDDIDVHLDRIDESDTGFATRFDAGLLEAYKPVLIDRRDNYEQRTVRQRSIIGRSIAGLIGRAEEVDIHQQEIRGWRTKASLHLAFNRSNLEFFVASAREGRNRDPELSELNHDGYIIRDNKKVPVKWRGSARQANEYDPRVLYLPYRPIVIDALKDVTGLDSLSGKRADDLSPLLIAEAHSERLVGWERDWADRVTEYVVQSVLEFPII